MVPKHFACELCALSRSEEPELATANFPKREYVGIVGDLGYVRGSSLLWDNVVVMLHDLSMCELHHVVISTGLKSEGMVVTSMS